MMTNMAALILGLNCDEWKGEKKEEKQWRLDIVSLLCPYTRLGIYVMTSIWLKKKSIHTRNIYSWRYTGSKEQRLKSVVIILKITWTGRSEVIMCTKDINYDTHFRLSSNPPANHSSHPLLGTTHSLRHCPANELFFFSLQALCCVPDSHNPANTQYPFHQVAATSKPFHHHRWHHAPPSPPLRTPTNTQLHSQSPLHSITITYIAPLFNQANSSSGRSHTYYLFIDILIYSTSLLETRDRVIQGEITYSLPVQ